MRHPKRVNPRRETLRSRRLLRNAASQLREVAEEMRRSNLDDEADTLNTTIRDLAWQCEMLLSKELAESPADSRRALSAIS